MKKKEGFLSPQKVISAVELEQGEVVIDFGSGSGYWAIPMAKIVGAKGLVFAIDAKEENLRIVKDKANSKGLNNIRYFKAPYSSKTIPIPEKADFILISNILSETKRECSLVSSAKKNAKKGTRLVIIDWNAESRVGPAKEHRVDIEEVLLTAQKAGFEFKRLLPAGDHHFGLYFVFNG